MSHIPLICQRVILGESVTVPFDLRCAFCLQGGGPLSSTSQLGVSLPITNQFQIPFNPQFSRWTTVRYYHLSFDKPVNESNGPFFQSHAAAQPSKVHVRGHCTTIFCQERSHRGGGGRSRDWRASWFMLIHVKSLFRFFLAMESWGRLIHILCFCFRR